MKIKSEFGKGLTYCLGLFLAHTWMMEEFLKKEKNYSLWFNGAGDHLFKLEIPDFLPKKIQKMLKVLQDKVLYWRCNPATKDDFSWSLEEAKDLLIEIDKYMGIKPIKGTWE